MSQTLRNLQKSRQGTPTNLVSFPAMLGQFKGEVARALPRHLSPDRIVRVALTAFRLNPKLADVDPRNVFAAVIQSSQLGLEVGLMGEAHLVPFGSQCQLIPGYQGLMKLARIRRLCQLLPKSPELAMALAMDELNERGETQNLGIAEAIDGSWAPVLDEPPDDAGQASDPARVATRKPLTDLLASIGQALSIEALDEVYAQAEDAVAGDDLEQLLRAYRSRKAALTQPSQLSPSSPIRGVVNSPSV